MYAVQVGQQSLLLYTCCLLQYFEYALKKKVLTYLIHIPNSRMCEQQRHTPRSVGRDTDVKGC